MPVRGYATSFEEKNVVLTFGFLTISKKFLKKSEMYCSWDDCLTTSMASQDTDGTHRRDKRLIIT